MSRHRFLMLGASIVGVGMLPFAQRNYAYAQGTTVTPENYGTASDLANPQNHTTVLRNMFSDSRLRAPYHFHLPPRPPNPEINGDNGGWTVVMGSSFQTFPVKSNWKLTGELASAEVLAQMSPETRQRATLPNGTVLDPASALHRGGEVVKGQRMFHNIDTKNGNSDVTFSNVYVEGHKFEWAEMNGGYFDLDQPATFLRFGQHPQEQRNRWNYRLRFVGCLVRNWPGITCDFRQLNDFEVSNNEVSSSHRGSFIFRVGARYGRVYNNHVLDGGDDCIAFNGNTGDYASWPNTGGAANVTLSGNILSEKQGQDIPEPAGYRHRDGNSPVAIRHATGPVYVNDTTVEKTEDGYTDWEGGWHRPQPAVEVRDLNGFTSRQVLIERLHVLKTAAPALWIPSTGVTGGVYDSVCDEYTGSLCPWQLRPAASVFKRSGLVPDSVCTS